MKCLKVVHTGFKGLIKFQCSRNATKEGYCWQHHSEAVKQREEKSAKRLEATPFYMIHRY